MDMKELPAQSTDGNGVAHYYDEPVLKPPDWGWSVIGYLWMGGIGAGSFVTASLAALRGRKDDRAIAKLGYTISTLAMGVSAPLLISHLGRPARFHHMLRIFKPRSPMNAGVWGMTSLSAVAAGAALVNLTNAGSVPRAMAALAGLPPALFVGSYTGVLLSHSSIPLWAKSPLLPALFACSALATGAAAVGLAAELLGVGSTRARKRVADAERIGSLAEAIALAAWLSDVGEYAKPLREPPLKDLFEKAVQGAGIAAPLALPSTKESSIWDVIKPALVLAGGLALRYVLIEGGRKSSQDADAYLKFTSQPQE
jgi:formate-dependent nitrite reductase membrane component NrfD